MIYVIGIILLIAIAYQDIRDRMISWFLPVLFFIIPFIDFALSANVSSDWVSRTDAIVLNLIFISIQFFFLFVYMYIKKKSIKNDFIGIGDIVFIYSLISWFNLQNLVVYLILSLLFSLILSFFFLYKKNGKNTSIPLAGLQAIFFIIIYITCYLFSFPYNISDWII